VAFFNFWCGWQELVTFADPGAAVIRFAHHIAVTFQFLPASKTLCSLSRTKKQKRHPKVAFFNFWCGWQELNPRPLGS
jgi:hypothetical protein